MASLNSFHYFITTTTSSSFLIILLLLHHLLSPVSCSNRLKHSISPRELLFEEKNRIGSIPPSCHNKCNQCHPCMAVQVPSLPSYESLVQQDLTKTSSMEGIFKSSKQGSNRYSNYKPLGWKCHCGDHFFNP